jgi:hypothetical protein
MARFQTHSNEKIRLSRFKLQEAGKSCKACIAKKSKVAEMIATARSIARRLSIRGFCFAALALSCLSSGCSWVHHTIDHNSLGSLVGNDSDDSIRREALEDDSFPAATDAISEP